MLPEFGSESKQRDEFAHCNAALNAPKFTGRETTREGFSEVAAEPAPPQSHPVPFICPVSDERVPNSLDSWVLCRFLPCCPRSSGQPARECLRPGNGSLGSRSQSRQWADRRHGRPSDFPKGLSLGTVAGPEPQPPAS